MKRSKINQCIREMEAAIKEHRFEIPPFCKFTPEEWKSKGPEYDEIRDNQLGWDITDCGLENFDKVGFSLITLRNGNLNMREKYPKVYAEKLIHIKEGQTFPYHYHVAKSEDIINRGGGVLYITVYNAARKPGEKTVTAEGVQKAPNSLEFSGEDVLVNTDGRSYYVPAGTPVRLEPGESITLWPYQYHKFSVEEGSGYVLCGEVSMCNDDDGDNYFYEQVGRFPAIEEDEAPYRLLCKDY